MTDAQINDLFRLARRLVSLTKDPHPEIPTWNQAVENIRAQIYNLGR